MSKALVIIPIFALLLLGCSNSYERDNPTDPIHVYGTPVTYGNKTCFPHWDTSLHFPSLLRQIPRLGGVTSSCMQSLYPKVKITIFMYKELFV